MKHLTEKLREAERAIAEDKGRLNFFALLQREDLSDRWDLVIAAPWAREDEATLRYLAAAIGQHLSPEEMTLLARIVILQAAESPVRAITEMYPVEHGCLELTEPARFGLPVKHGYLITSRAA